jgi:hypothetical protein
MARQYSIKSVFRNTPNKLLARYFQEHNTLTDFDFTSLKENKPDVLFNAWLALDDNTKQYMDVDFQDIFNLSCEKGVKAIIDEVKELGPDKLINFTEWLADKKNHYDKAFSTFLDYPEYWKGASLLFHAYSFGYWRKRKKLPKVEAQCEDRHLRKLAGLIADYFHHTEPRVNIVLLNIYAGADLIISLPTQKTILNVAMNG